MPESEHENGTEETAADEAAMAEAPAVPAAELPEAVDLAPDVEAPEAAMVEPEGSVGSDAEAQATSAADVEAEAEGEAVVEPDDEDGVSATSGESVDDAGQDDSAAEVAAVDGEAAADAVVADAAADPAADDEVPETANDPDGDAATEIEANPVEALDADADQGDDEVVAHASARLRSIVESVLFAAGDPITIGRLCQILGGYERKEVKAALADIEAELQEHERGIRLEEVAGGFQFRSASENHDFVKALFAEKPTRLSKPALETLSIVAYRQPCTRVDVEAIRGVDAGGMLSTLVDRRLVKVAGRKEVVGRPLLYATTPEFLEMFGLKDLAALPTLEEIGAAVEAMERALQLVADAEAGELSRPEEATTEAPDDNTPEDADPTPEGGDATLDDTDATPQDGAPVDDSTAEAESAPIAIAAAEAEASEAGEVDDAVEAQEPEDSGDSMESAPEEETDDRGPTTQ